MRSTVFCLLLWIGLSVGQETNETTSASVWSARSVSRVLQQCLSGTQRWQCLGEESERLLEAATRDKSTWQLSEYLSIEPMAEEEEPSMRGRSATGFAGKLLQLAQGRALRVRLPRQLTISNAIDDFGNGLGVDQGRKKKDKDKHMAMMGGMIMLATFAQMFLGKVILIAGSAFIMAKIALLISLLGSLKKGMTGHSGSPEHVIVSSSGHSHESGWHRSMPTDGYSTAQLETAGEETPHGHEQAYYAYETDELRRRQLAATTTTSNTQETGKPKRGFL